MTTTTERNSQPTRTQLVDSAVKIQGLLRKQLADSDINRRQTDDAIDALSGAGFFRLNKPRRFGGYPVDLRTILQITETLAEADGSAAWVVGIASTGAWAGTRGSEQLQEEIFGADPDARIAGSGMSCPARHEQGGLRLNGRWGYASGSPHATWAALAATVTDTLDAGTIVNISGLGPWHVDALDWYAVDTGEPVRFGYAAAGVKGVSYLELLPARCPDGVPDRATLVGLTAWERLTCLRDQSLTITGTFGCPVCGEFVPGSYEPSWLASPMNLNYIGWPDTLTLHFDPAVELDRAPNASMVRVTGHFSDPASTTCVIQGPGEPPVPIDPVIAELYCREQFVVESIEVIGSDPDFTYSYPPA